VYVVLDQQHSHPTSVTDEAERKLRNVVASEVPVRPEGNLPVATERVGGVLRGPLR
jgi:hypothetical protein